MKSIVDVSIERESFRLADVHWEEFDDGTGIFTYPEDCGLLDEKDPHPWFTPTHWMEIPEGPK
jgi:hypothetical protein